MGKLVFGLLAVQDTTLHRQAWIEASTKGAVLLFTASEIESRGIAMGLNPGAAGLLGGMGGGIAQAYATMGAYISICFRMRSLTIVLRRLLYLHEDCRDHSS